MVGLTTYYNKKTFKNTSGYTKMSKALVNLDVNVCIINIDKHTNKISLKIPQSPIYLYRIISVERLFFPEQIYPQV